MFTTILSALLPVVLTMVLGYFAGRHHDFTPEHADVLNRLVLLYALPADLFVGMATTKRSNLSSSAPLIVTVVSAIVLSFAIAFVLSRKVLHKSPGTSALYALAVSGPSVAFVGNSVLGYLYGQQESAIPISIATLAINLVLVPLCLVLLDAEAAAGAAGMQKLDARALGKGLVRAVRQPMVWASILGLIVCLAGFDFPASIERALGLLGASTGGVSIFAAGVILYAQKVTFSRTIGVLTIARNLIVPGVALLCIRLLGRTSAELNEAVIALAIPAASMIVILAVRYKTAEQEMASVLLYSTVGSIFSLSLFIWLTR
ncbi:MAG TPA: AEC family transporter [Thermomicrobiales bacterium]|nr:AEC family transporter [Thermomicrobiales bacterium]